MLLSLEKNIATNITLEHQAQKREPTIHGSHLNSLIWLQWTVSPPLTLGNCLCAYLCLSCFFHWEWFLFLTTPLPRSKFIKTLSRVIFGKAQKKKCLRCSHDSLARGAGIGLFKEATSVPCWSSLVLLHPSTLSNILISWRICWDWDSLRRC